MPTIVKTAHRSKGVVAPMNYKKREISIYFRARLG